MKKNKRTAKKHNRYNGYNVYGQRCEVRTVKLNQETALEQCLDVFRKVEIAQANGRRLEYTLDWSGMDREEAERVARKLDAIAKLRNMCVGSFQMSC